jgi:hypothetical protein
VRIRPQNKKGVRQNVTEQKHSIAIKGARITLQIANVHAGFGDFASSQSTVPFIAGAIFQ